MFVDGRCVTNQRPLLESGTLGAKGHIQVIEALSDDVHHCQRFEFVVRCQVGLTPNSSLVLPPKLSVAQTHSNDPTSSVLLSHTRDFPIPVNFEVVYVPLITC